MEDPDPPLDFESEDPLLSTPLVTASKKKRKKIIGLDDLLSEFYQGKSSPSESKKSSKSRFCNSDEEDNTRKNKEKLLSKFVDECQKQVSDMITEDEIPLWGQRVFGLQKSPPRIDFKEVINGKLVQSFQRIKLNLVLDLTIEKGETFLEHLLIDGWLSKLVLFCGSVEDCIASWTFYQMLYSPNEEVQESACDFWCSILPREAEVNMPPIGLKWFPSYTDLRDALEIYGYLSGSNGSSSALVTTENGSRIYGPPLNIRCWLTLVAAFCRMRNARSIFSSMEVEELFGVVTWLLLDRQLQGLSLILHECMQSIISFFTDNEWPTSCANIATSIANRVPKDLNCLRVVECMSGVNARSKSLRSEVAHQILVHCINKPGVGILESLKLLMSINVKDKGCVFIKVYIYLVLAENWLLSGSLLQEGSAITEMWSRYLRSLSSQITSTDWRSYASKVRNRASYLLQNMHTWQDHKMLDTRAP